jgi:hypothetical protein
MGRVRGGSWFKRGWSGFPCRMLTMCTVLVAGFVLTGCVTGPQWGPDDREKLITASHGYATMLRWRELDTACRTYVDESAREGCLERAQTLKDLQITDIRTKDLDVTIVGGSATVTVEIEYFLLPSMIVRIIQDNQKWIFLGPTEKKVWRITSPLPNFAAP